MGTDGHSDNAEKRDRDGRQDPFLLAEVAQRYYLEDLTQEQIARRLGVSRSQVSRMLKEAREQGIVEIRVHHPLRTVPELQQALQPRCPCRTVWSWQRPRWRAPRPWQINWGR